MPPEEERFPAVAAKPHTTPRPASSSTIRKTRASQRSRPANQQAGLPSSNRRREAMRRSGAPKRQRWTRDAPVSVRVTVFSCQLRGTQKQATAKKLQASPCVIAKVGQKVEERRTSDCKK